MGDRFSLAVPAAASLKAVEDAKKAQAAVAAQCAVTGRELPPYELSELIGKGSFGRVYKAVDKAHRPERLVAVKIINIEEGDGGGGGSAGGVDTFGDIMKEVNTLKLLGQAGARNINVVLDSLLVGQSVWIVTEHCAGGSVSTLMRPTGFLQERWIIPILREVAEALFWVHRQGIIHRDIKCANVLITAAGGVQLCDFGVAGIVETKFDKRRTVTGTLHWMAPELFHQHVAYGTEVDIWAFGAMAYEVASGLPPNARVAIDPYDFGAYLGQHAPRLEGAQYSPALRALVAFCLVPDPAQRPAIAQVQRHPYLANTAASHPTESLLTLMSAYRLWQSRGGGRLSLFAPGGAQAGAGAAVPGAVDRSPDWDFDDDEYTDVDDDEYQDVHFHTAQGLPRASDPNNPEWFAPDDAADAEAVYAAYGLALDGGPGPGFCITPPDGESTAASSAATTMTAVPSTPDASLSRRRRRRPPPHITRLEVPLEKVFNPNTLTNYHDNARAVYGRIFATSPQTSDLPLREEATKYPVRESLIDLDASLVPANDEETIRGPHRNSVSEDLSRDFARRRTQDWTFPTAAAAHAGHGGSGGGDGGGGVPASSSSDVVPSYDWSSDPEHDMRPPKPARFTQEWTFPTATAASNVSNNLPTLDLPDQGPLADVDRYDTSASLRRQSALSLIDLDGATSPANRLSALSLIDLDMSIVDDEPPPRPSTALSEDTGTGSETEDAPFGLDYARRQQPDVPGPVSTVSAAGPPPGARYGREPSMYVPDGIGFLAEAEPTAPIEDHGHDPISGRSAPAAVPQPADAALAPGATTSLVRTGLPVAPLAPAGRVLEGMATRDDIKDELLRLIDSLSNHLQMATGTLERLPVLTARRSLTERDVVS